MTIIQVRQDLTSFQELKGQQLQNFLKGPLLHKEDLPYHDSDLRDVPSSLNSKDADVRSLSGTCLC